MTALVVFTAIAAGLSLAMMLAWWVAGRSGNHGWVDTIWSFATGAAAIAAALLPLGAEGWLPRQLLVAGLAAIWSLRLGGHILRRTMAGHDDARYADLRRQWGKDASRRLFQFLQAQALAGFVLAIAIASAAHQPHQGWRIWDMAGVVLFLASVLGAGLADRQLARFRAVSANRGHICDHGLWGVSRHPNYFFEWLGWVAYPVIAFDISGGYLWSLLALAGPVLMYVVLVHASGIPPTEAHMLRTRGAAFEAYRKRVNAFWPGPPGA